MVSAAVGSGTPAAVGIGTVSRELPVELVGASLIRSVFESGSVSTLLNGLPEDMRPRFGAPLDDVVEIRSAELETVLVRG